MKFGKDKKIKYFFMILLVVMLIFVLNYVFFSEIISKNMETLYKKYLDKQDGNYKVENSRVYSLNLKENSYNNLITYNGIGTGQIRIQKNKYEYYISLGIFCFNKTFEGNRYVKIGMCNKKQYDFYATNKEHTFIVPKTGTYKLELWAAGGGDAHALGILFDKGGSGAYTSGDIYLKKGEVLYIQVGSRGQNGKIIEDDSRLTGFYYPSLGGKGGYNGGGNGFDDPQTDAGGGGGGATDIRLISSDWKDFDSLKSRIMVAGAGGGSSRYYSHQDSVYKRGTAGAGGTTTGINALNLLKKNKVSGYGATQTTGYKFGIGENGDYCMTSANGAGGGAGGYFGSKGGACGLELFEMPTGAGGGSSYVSGCKGCNAIDKESTEDNLIFTNQPNHYSGKIFTNIIMKSGAEKMPNPNGGTMTGNRNDGYARITFIK